MPGSITRFGNLHRIFKNGDSALLNEVGALCILFEDFRHEFASIRDLASDMHDPDKTLRAHPVLYYVRRSLITLDEANERLHAICNADEFRLSMRTMRNELARHVIEARRFINRNAILKRLRNHVGAHIDPEKVVQASIRYLGPEAISKIGYNTNATNDFALQLDFATYILEGAMASHLPGGVPALGAELAQFLGVLAEAHQHFASATYSLALFFLWDKFGA